MSLVLPTLLCLELILGQSTQAQKGGLLQPTITAHPGSLVLSKKNVTIQCQEFAEAEAYKIFKEGEPEPREAETSTLCIKEMTPDQTGLYYCFYKSGKLWSPHSATLTVVMTGVYKKPLLSSMSGTVVASGDHVTLMCFLKFKFDRFILIKEEEFHTLQNQSATCQDNQHQAIFYKGPVTHTQAGTYRCYGAFNKDPYVWSHPSDPLELEVKEFPDGSTRPTDLGPTQEFPDGSTRPTDLGATQDASQNLPLLIGLPVAILMFLLLPVLLFLFLHHHKAKNKATKTGDSHRQWNQGIDTPLKLETHRTSPICKWPSMAPTRGTFRHPDRPTPVNMQPLSHDELCFGQEHLQLPVGRSLLWSHCFHV